MRQDQAADGRNQLFRECPKPLQHQRAKRLSLADSDCICDLRAID
jgi:hypothetical protein